MENTENELRYLATLAFDSWRYPSFLQVRRRIYGDGDDQNSFVWRTAREETIKLLELVMIRGVENGQKPLEALYTAKKEDWPFCFDTEPKEIKHVAHLAEAVERAAKKGKDDGSS